MADTGGVSRRRFRVLPTVLLTAVILALPTAVYAWGRTSSSFDIRHVRAGGTHLVPQRKVVRLLRSEFLGENLFAVTGDDVLESLEPLAYVKDVTVDRAFPDTLHVTVIEHRPLLHVLAANGWWTVASDGFVVCPSARTPGDTKRIGRAPAEGVGSKDQPAASPSPSAKSGSTAGQAAAVAAVTGSPPAALGGGPPRAALTLPAMAVDGSVRAGTTLAKGGVASALHVVRLLPAKVRGSLRTVQASKQGDLTLRFSGGLVVKWGDRGRSAAKSLALKAVLAAYARAGQDPDSLDVSVPDRVLARPILK